MNRLVGVEKTGGGRTRFMYVDPPSALSVTEESDQYGADYRKRGVAEYDGMGREWRRTRGGTGVTEVAGKREYDALGRVWREYQAGYGNPSAVYREYTYDGLGRVTKVKHSGDGTEVVTEYVLNWVTVTDESQKRVTRKYDALGRLTEVLEDPGGLNYRTVYGYDVMDQLKTVEQYGAGGTVLLARSFEYDSLGRMRKAVNPEKGVVRYRYDAAGNVTEAREADGGTVTMAYDALNRLTGKTYAGGSGVATPAGVWCYDGQVYDTATGLCGGTVVAQSRGKLTSAGNAVSKTVLAHDALGRVSESRQHTPADGAAYQFTYTYYRDDSAATVKYPGGREVTACRDALGREVWVSGTKGKTSCEAGEAVTAGYATGLTYEAHGGWSQRKLGNGLWESRTYNSREQVGEIRLGTVANGAEVWKSRVEYFVGNNGNVERTVLGLPGKPESAMRYGYDGVNRLKVAVEGWGEAALPGLCVAGRVRGASSSGMTLGGEPEAGDGVERSAGWRGSWGVLGDEQSCDERGMGVWGWAWECDADSVGYGLGGPVRV